MAIAISYFLIPIFLITVLVIFRSLISWKYFVLGILFVLFILVCGIGHLIKVYNFWWGNFELEILIDRLTAVLSMITAFLTLVATYQLLKNVLRAPSEFLSNMEGALALIGGLHVLSKKSKQKKR
jgi:formate hydrogenlyase subunit 3/multisubunit Na+/H+ antiporter MnhD subunit